MRSWLFISALLLLVACQSEAEQQDVSPAQPVERVRKTEAPTPQSTPKVDPVELNERLEKSREKAKEPAEVMGGEISVHKHNAPNQPYIDSVKAAKTKGKK